MLYSYCRCCCFHYHHRCWCTFSRMDLSIHFLHSGYQILHKCDMHVWWRVIYSAGLSCCCNILSRELFNWWKICKCLHNCFNHAIQFLISFFIALLHQQCSELLFCLWFLSLWEFEPIGILFPKIASISWGSATSTTYCHFQVGLWGFVMIGWHIVIIMDAEKRRWWYSNIMESGGLFCYSTHT